MPTHLHLIAFDEDFDIQRLKSTIADLRKYAARKMLEYTATCLPSCFIDVFRSSAGKDRVYRFWQEYMHPEAIYMREFCQQKMDYIHENPVRKGLVREASGWVLAGRWIFGCSVVTDCMVITTGLRASVDHGSPRSGDLGDQVIGRLIGSVSRPSPTPK